MGLVAALVLGACGGAGGETSQPTPEESQPTPEETKAPGADVVVEGTASFDFVPSEVEAAAGTITVALTSTGGPHTFTVELDDSQETVAQVFSPGETGTGEIELEAGTYVFFCVIPGHRDEGMVGTLTVF